MRRKPRRERIPAVPAATEHSLKSVATRMFFRAIMMSSFKSVRPVPRHSRRRHAPPVAFIRLEATIVPWNTS